MILGIVVGYAVWTAIWLGGNALLFREAASVVQGGEAYTHVPGLAGILLLSIACSVAAGAVTAAIARSRAGAAVLVMAILLLVTGVGVQIGVWHLMPAWYHLAFLALLVPVSLAGGRLAPKTA